MEHIITRRVSGGIEIVSDSKCTMISTIPAEGEVVISEMMGHMMRFFTTLPASQGLELFCDTENDEKVCQGRVKDESGSTTQRFEIRTWRDTHYYQTVFRDGPYETWNDIYDPMFGHFFETLCGQIRSWKQAIGGNDG